MNFREIFRIAERFILNFGRLIIKENIVGAISSNQLFFFFSFSLPLSLSLSLPSALLSLLSLCNNTAPPLQATSDPPKYLGFEALYLRNLVVPLAHQKDTGRKRNGGEKFRLFRSDFSIPATTADENGINAFVSVW